MLTNRLAIDGGDPVISYQLKKFNTIGQPEIDEVVEVLQSGLLSGYMGAPGEHFMGGPRVRKFEADVCSYFGVKNAVAVNSWTSGLITAIGAIGVNPGDEIITTPWTMAATATAILHWNCIPVFADIKLDTYNIDPDCVEQLITSRTKAILAVDIFGQSADILKLRELADKYHLRLICDTAQSPGARFENGFAGTLVDIGGFSLNYHKHIHCGEGGVLVTNDDSLARRMELIRNHGEVVIAPQSKVDLVNILGYNFRMCEIEAAIATVQLTKLQSIIESRQHIARYLNSRLCDLTGLSLPTVAENSSHVYYIYGMQLDLSVLRTTRSSIVAALRAEGVPGIIEGYQNIHLLPCFTEKIAYGTDGFPWNSPFTTSKVQYKKGTCPVAETLHDETFFGMTLCMFEYADSDVEDVVEHSKRFGKGCNLIEP